MKFISEFKSLPCAKLPLKRKKPIMRFCMLLLIAFLLQISTKVYSQVTLHEKQATLERVLQKIEKQTGYSFIYDEDKLKISDITVVVDNVSMEKALNACFKNQPVAYSIVGKNIILKPVAAASPTNVQLLPEEKSILVKGKVTDTTGQPIYHATVFFINRNNLQNQSGYVTGEDGLFEIEANENEMLAVSFIGYQTVTFLVKKDMPFQTIVLHTYAAQLDQVVVQTGYQTLLKERATGSFSKPDMKTFSARSNTMDVIGRLDGQIPGLYVSQNIVVDPTTHASSRSALVRGASSILLSTEPLYVVNGVIVTDFSSINVDDIADITVLKDAAAAAIWGAAAANGVIVITTKNGSKNQKLRISYQGFVNFQGKPNLDYQRYLTSSQYIQAAKETFDPAAYPYGSLYGSFIAPHEQILYDQDGGLISAAQATASLDSLARISNKQQIKDLWYRNAITTNHTLSVSGGGGTYSFYGSLGYTNTQSSTPGEKNNTYRVNFNQTYVPNKRFTLSLSTSLADVVSSGKHPISIDAGALPYQLFQDANEQPLNMPYIYGMSAEQRADYQDLSGIDLETYSPLGEFNYGHSNTDNLSLNLVADATVKLWKGLSFQGTYGYLTAPGANSSYNDHAEYSLRTNLVGLTLPGADGAAPTYLLPATGGTFITTHTNQRNWTVRNQLVYVYSSANQAHELNVQGGQEARENLTKGETSTILGYNEDLQTYPFIDYLKLSQGVPGTVTGFGYYYPQPFRASETKTRFNSYFVLASYTFRRTYSFDASWRVDHSNVFGSDLSAQNKPVYSFGGRWNLTKENFMKPVAWVNNLSLRATYGITGNSPYVGAASTLDILYNPFSNFSSYPYIAGLSYNISDKANAKLSWESTHTTNVGLDFGILNNRLSGSVNYYYKKTTDLLGTIEVDPFASEMIATANLGELVNRGFDAGLNSINVRSENFTWSSGVVFAVNSNKLVSYSAPQSYQNTTQARLYATYVIGMPVNPLYAYRYAGLDNVGDPQIKLADGTITKSQQAPEAKDLVYKGSIVPKYTGGIQNNFRYKQFELSINMVYSLGAVMRRDVNQKYFGRLTGSSQSFSGNISADFMDRWKKPGDENTTDIPSYTTDNFYNFTQRNTDYYTMADINVVSASYLKLRDASLSYNLPQAVVKRLKIQRAALRFQVNNVLLWKANKYGIDPEYQQFKNGFRGLPQGQHALTVGANIDF